MLPDDALVRAIVVIRPAFYRYSVLLPVREWFDGLGCRILL